MRKSASEVRCQAGNLVAPLRDTERGLAASLLAKAGGHWAAWEVGRPCPPTDAKRRDPHRRRLGCFAVSASQVERRMS